MRNVRAICIFFLALFLSCCSCGNSSRHGDTRIGIDPDWYPIDFQALQSYVNGYTEDLLLEVSKYSGMQIEKITAGWDSLMDGLNEKKYDAILTSMPPYNFNQAKYDFSENFLDLGPVLIVPVGASHTDLSKMSNEVVGVVTGDPAILILQKYPDIVLRKYGTVPELLDAAVDGSIEGALLNRLTASSYVRDIYSGKLKIASAPLTDAGLHLLTLKGKHDHLVHVFNKSIKQLKKKKKIEALQKKWQLDS
ncbi:MAG: transporter substrate-binding domain-containing protein [Verrucomicrobia bacterium]|nr:transporter substrate-binding domain-containing protein [Verrucomicrobiota bacterium]